MPTVLKIFNPSVTLRHFPTKQPRLVPTLPPDTITRKKPSNIHSNGQSDQLSGSPSLYISLHPIHLPIITPTKFPSDVP